MDMDQRCRSSQKELKRRAKRSQKRAAASAGQASSRNPTLLEAQLVSVVDGSIPQQGGVARFDVKENPLKQGEMQACNVSAGSGQKGQGGGKGGQGAFKRKPGAYNGTVKNFFGDKGFGFVTRSDGADFFVHIKSVVDGSIPQQGDLVRFDVEENPLKPGEMQACNVSVGSGQKGQGKGGFGKHSGGGGKGQMSLGDLPRPFREDKDLCISGELHSDAHQSELADFFHRLDPAGGGQGDLPLLQEAYPVVSEAEAHSSFYSCPTS